MTNNWARWLEKVMKTKDPRHDLKHIRNLVLVFASLKSTDNLLDIGTGLGFLGFNAYEKLKEKGKVVAIDTDVDCIYECQKFIEDNSISKNYELHNMDILNNTLPKQSFDVVVSRSVIMHIKDKQKAFNEIYKLLKNNGRFSAFEPIHPRKTERFYKFLTPQKITDYDKIKKIEENIRNDINDHLTNYDLKSIKNNLKKAGFTDIKIFSYPEYEYGKYTENNIHLLDKYFEMECFPFCAPLKNKFLNYMSEQEFDTFLKEAKDCLLNKHLFLTANNNYFIALKTPSFESRLNFFIMGVIYGTIFKILKIFKKLQHQIKWCYLSNLNK